MRFRFRKSFTIIPGILKWTVTKKGASLNLTLGPLSKSWGTGGRRSTTIDAPGTAGVFWRNQASAPKRDHPMYLPWVFLVMAVGLLMAFYQSYLHFGTSCNPEGNPFTRYLIWGGVQLVLSLALMKEVRKSKARIGVFVIASLLANWGAYSLLVAPLMHCN